MAIVVNKLLPEFESNATGGVRVSNVSHVGNTVVLYFYPKDNTPGCTTEAMQFRDKYKDFVKAGAHVFGVSRDNMKSHDEFKSKLELPFELIADTEEKMCHMFGVVKNKIMYGKKVKGIERSTFLIDAEGVLREEWRGLKVVGHVDEVLKSVKAMKKGLDTPAPKPVAKTVEKTATKAQPVKSPSKELIQAPIKTPSKSSAKAPLNVPVKASGKSPSKTTVKTATKLATPAKK